MTNAPMRAVRRLVEDEAGATAIEYGLIASLIALAIITGATTLGSSLSSTFTFVASKMTTS